jgi:hypothetical protein
MKPEEKRTITIVWPTSDGKEYATKREAFAHERDILITKTLLDAGVLFGDSDGVVEAIVEQWPRLVEIMNALALPEGDT